MTIRSGVKMYGNNQGTDVPTIPSNNPSMIPIVRRDLRSNWACHENFEKEEMIRNYRLI